MSASQSPTITVQGPDGKPHIIHSDAVGLAALLDVLQGAQVSRDLLREARMFITGDLKLQCLPSETDRECANRSRGALLAKIDAMLGDSSAAVDSGK